MPRSNWAFHLSGEVLPQLDNYGAAKSAVDGGRPTVDQLFLGEAPPVKKVFHYKSITPKIKNPKLSFVRTAK